MQHIIKILTFLTVVTLSTSCLKVQHLATYESSNQLISEHSHTAKDSAMLAFVEPFRLEMEFQMNEVIGHTANELMRKQPDGPLNRVVADIIHDYAESALERDIDFAVQNYFGLRVNSLPDGPLTLGHLYELMPFENYLVVLEVPGYVVQELCNLIASNDGWPISYGLSFRIKDGNAHAIMVSGKEIDPNKTYRIATNDYLANGGDNALFFRDYPQISTGLLIRDVMIDHIRTLSLKDELLMDLGRGNRIHMDAP